MVRVKVHTWACAQMVVLTLLTLVKKCKTFSKKNFRIHAKNIFFAPTWYAPSRLHQVDVAPSRRAPSRYYTKLIRTDQDPTASYTRFSFLTQIQPIPLFALFILWPHLHYLSYDQACTIYLMTTLALFILRRSTFLNCHSIQLAFNFN